MRILLAWELGGNYGHLSKLLGVALHLRQRGHQVLFVVKNILTAGQLLENEGFRYLQSPRSVVRKNCYHSPVSFADILAGAGFGSYKVLDGLVKSWRGIFETIHPDVVVAQFAPVAQFTARLSNVRCLSLNTGFECPPDVAPFPCFRSYLRLTRDQLLARELEILHNINKICFRHGQISCSSLNEVLKSDIKLLATLPELDHYQDRRNEYYIGPISMHDYGETKRWSERNAQRIFVYLRPFPGIHLVLDALARSGADVIAHIPNLDNRISANYTNTSVRIATSMVKLSGLLSDMDLAITHAGHGTACATLLAGVPQLMIPTTIEQWLINRNMEYLGVGIGIRRESRGDAFKAALERLLADPSYRERAQKLATQYASYNQEQVIIRIGNTIERLPAWAARRNRDFQGFC